MRQPFLLLRDALAAAAAALAALPVVTVLAQPHRDPFHVLDGLLRMKGPEWALIAGGLMGPAFLLGTAAAYLIGRRKGRGTRSLAAAAGTAFLASALGHGAFVWWLYQVL